MQKFGRVVGIEPTQAWATAKRIAIILHSPSHSPNYNHSSSILQAFSPGEPQKVI